MASSSRTMLGPIGALLLVIVSCVPTAYSDPRISQAGLICLNGSGTPTPNIVSNFLTVFQDVAGQLNTRLYGISSIMSPAPAIYALAQCHEDLSATDCLLCFAQGRPIIPRCSVLSAASGRLYLDGCFLRFDYYNFFNETVDPAHDLITCNSTNATAGTGKYPVVAALTGYCLMLW
ncbi:hypothetical protein MLD38_027157 [Melastoma candidum]|uniref:Uncharacterized protein n=1 Tax=Melastoma candidum TaxID=119954 RepID=A0ACB9P1R5_9MYRT|nr:hypothetical protein MLD38_027157 [Melastoma candidum]